MFPTDLQGQELGKPNFKPLLIFKVKVAKRSNALIPTITQINLVELL
jgi:hypothetical protein